MRESAVGPPLRLSSAVLTALAVASSLLGCRIAESTDVNGQTDASADFHSQVREILALSADAWNAGDLEGFMSHYDRSPATTFIGGDAKLYGYDAIRARYAPRFRPGADRDSLRFEGLETRVLSARHGLATARYVLYRNGETTASGPFTLVLLNVEGRWKIIHDQSAADPESGPADAEPSEADGPESDESDEAA